MGTGVPGVPALCPSVLIRPRTNIYLVEYKQKMGEGWEQGWVRGRVGPAATPGLAQDRSSGGEGGALPRRPEDLGWSPFWGRKQVLGGERK